MHGIINLLKPPGMTSHDCVSFARRALGMKRIGHAGTLDPAAAGVLLLCVGSATRLAPFLLSGTKQYIAESTFGYETDTLDHLGKITAEHTDFIPDAKQVQEALSQFEGHIAQIPPHFSAIKKGGKKLYELAREGNLPELEPRPVYIERLQLLEHQIDNAARSRLHITCGSGTYIRSLVRDIGQHLGGSATMTFLVRTHCAHCAIEQSCLLEELADDPAKYMIPVPKVLSWCMDEVVTDSAKALRLSQGQKVPASWNGKLVGVLDEEQTLAVIAERMDEKGGVYRPRKVLWLS